MMTQSAKLPKSHPEFYLLACHGLAKLACDLVGHASPSRAPPGSLPLATLPSGRDLTLARIVRALAGDRHVVHVALAQSRTGDAQEPRLVVQLGERPRADVTHRRAQAAGELMQHGCRRALVGHLTLDAFGHQFQRVLDVL